MSYNYGGYVAPKPAGASAPPACASAATGQAQHNLTYINECKTVLSDLKIKRKMLDDAIEKLKSTGEKGQRDSNVSDQFADDAKETAKRLDKILDLVKEEITSFEKRLEANTPVIPKPTLIAPPAYSATPTPAPAPAPAYQHLQPAPTPTPPPAPYHGYQAPHQPQQHVHPKPAPTFQSHSYQPPPPATTHTSPKPATTSFNTGAFNGQPPPQAKAHYPPGHQYQPAPQPAQPTYKPAPAPAPAQPVTKKQHKSGKSSSSSSSSDDINKAFKQFGKDLNNAFKGKKDKKDKKDKKH